MSTWKMLKAMMGAQLIWLGLVTIVMIIIGVFVKDDKKTKPKMTKDGFHSPEMQKIYDRYINKEMQYGQS